MNATAPKARDIFLAAIKLSPAEWELYLEQACGADQDLRHRLVELLKAHREAGSFLAEVPAFAKTVDSPGDDTLVQEAPGRMIGPYKLLEQIGEGGFGTVFMAEQTHPVRRKVALKVLKPGMDTKQVVARFEAERQALAIMDHPNIAKVHDGGATPSGRPFFVMELVKGAPITDYCDQNQLTPRQRLELFVPVCQAVQHAHQKGIIHRDLKPSNVLVAVHDTTPVVKVIDFGVAKALGQELTEKTLFTGFAQMIGTPLYMSPEQAGQSSLDVDTRSDIYSLGVMLYELLTGTTPFDRARLKDASYEEIRRIIREEEPARPSNRISTLEAQAGSTIAEQRQSDPRRLRRLFRGEVDWIVMKALEKDRNRRYETANGLALDIQRYLADESVQACPPSAGYRLRKFARRNKAVLATGALVAASLVAAVVVLTISNRLVTAERNAKGTALTEKVQALAEKQTALHEKEAALTQANANFAEANRQEGLAKEHERVAKEQTALARRRLYASQMNLAMQAWRAGDAPRALELIEGQRPRVGEDDLRGFEWYYLWRLCNDGHLNLTGHTEAILAAAYAPDGKTLASASEDGTVRLWDAASGRERFVLRAHTSHPWDVAFSPDGKLLASGGKYTGEVIVWNVDSGEPIRTMPGAVDGLAFSPDGKTLLAGGNSAQIWDVTSGKKLRTIPEPGAMIGMLRDGQTVVTLANGWTKECEIRFWDWESGARRLTIAVPGAGEAALSPDRARIATCGDHVKVWDTANGELLADCQTEYSTRKPAFSPDGTRLAVGQSDRRVVLWDLATRKRLAEDVHHDAPWAVAWSPDGGSVASVTLGGEFKVWNLTTPQEATAIPAVGARELQFSSDSRTLLVGQSGPTLVFDVATGGKLAELPFGDVSAISARGGIAAQLVGTSHLKIWNVNHGREIANLPLPASREYVGVALSPDERHAAAFFQWREDNRLTLWDIANRHARTLTMDGHFTWSVLCADFSPDGNLVAAGYQFQWVAVWDVATGKIKLQFSQPPAMLNIVSLKFSPDGKVLAAGSENGMVTLWDVERGQRIAACKGHASSVPALTFSPDGEVLATFGTDRTVRFWDWRTGQERMTLSGHGGRSYRIQFSPDGKTLATSAGDSVRLWRAATAPEAAAPRSADVPSSYERIEVDPPASAAGLRNSAESFIRCGLLQEAAADFARAIELEDSRDSLQFFLHAFLRVYVADIPGYQKACRRMLEKFGDSTDPEEWNRVGAALSVSPEAGVEPSRAVALLERAVADNKWVYRQAYLGIAHYRAGQFERAKSALEGSLAIDARWNPPWVHSALAMAWHRLGRRERALAALETARSAREERVESILAGAVGYWPCPWWDAAYAELLYSEAYSQIHGSPPLEDPRLVVFRARGLDAIGRADEARAEFARAFAMAPTDLLIRVRTLPPTNKTDEYARGLADLRAFLKDHPEQPEGSRLALARAHLQWGAARWNAGRRQEGETAFDQAIDVAPQNAQLFLERGNLWVDFGEFTRAIGDYSKALEQAQGPDWRSAIYHQRGLAHSRLGHYPEALDDFAKVIELDPDNVMNRYWQALAHVAAGDLDGYKRACAAMLDRFGQSDKPEIGYWVAWTAVLAPAAVADMTVPITLAETALARDPQNSSFANTVGATLFRAGRFDEAVQRLSAVSTAWEEAVTKPTMYSPAYPWFFLAMAQHRLGHAEEGRQWFDRAVQQMDEETRNESVAWNRRATLQLFRQEAERLLKK